MKDEDREMIDPIVEYLRVLAICQNVVPEIVDDKCTIFYL